MVNDRTQNGLTEKMWDQNERPNPPAFDKIKNFDSIANTENIIMGAQDLLFMGLKFLIKMIMLKN